MRQIFRHITRAAPALLLLAGLSLPAPQALAQATPAGAANLERLIQDRLGAATSNEPDQFRLERVPEVQVTAQGDIYAVSLPKLRLLTDGGWLLEAPVVEAEVKPLPDGGWEVEASIPQPLSVFSERGFRAGDLTIGQQKLHARWSADGYLLNAADLSLANVAFHPTSGGGLFNLASLTLKLDPARVTGDAWTGIFNLALGGLNFQAPTGMEKIALQKLRLRGDAAGLDLTKFAQASRIWRGGGLPTANQLERLATALKLELDLAGYQQVHNDGRRTKLDSGGGTLALDGLSGDRAGMRLDWRHAGLDRRGADIEPALVPASADIALNGSRLPPTPLLALLATYASDTSDGPRKAAREQLFTAMQTAGSNLNIDRLSLKGPQTAVSGNGAFKFASQNPRGLTGQADLSMSGIDRLIAAIQASGGTKAAGTAIALYAVQGLGQPEQGADGITHRYQLQILPDGRIMLNGNDMQNVAGLLTR
ncbi:DUF2125 domain-containing protein [Niveispirillum sp. BGYR6]|uniref:DUF2125 domain-containing protein n=1 Tax=Niveispirillum sp. BGYR6 TaxID=2971249 RepID=UPI0022B94EAB|nr:DUF2125 domain-containing protein [Niveispirillum sp. BGYR6]MDG5497589.1 DUF2125 domain-containing protein [Niveispirillum sp. BGYR6]